MKFKYPEILGVGNDTGQLVKYVSMDNHANIVILLLLLLLLLLLTSKYFVVVRNAAKSVAVS